VSGSEYRTHSRTPTGQRTGHPLSVNRTTNRTGPNRTPSTLTNRTARRHDSHPLVRRQCSRRRPCPRQRPPLVPRSGHRRTARLAGTRPLPGLLPRSRGAPSPIIWARLGARESPSTARPAITGTPGGRPRGDASGDRAVTRWAIRPDGTLRPVATGPRVHCALCGHEVASRAAWQVPRASGEFYCRDHFSTDDRRLRHEFEEAEP